MSSSIWSMFSGASTGAKASSSGASPEIAKTSPKIQGNTGPSRPSPGDRPGVNAMDGGEGVPAFMKLAGYEVQERPAAAPTLVPTSVAGQQAYARPPMPPQTSDGEVSDYYVKKVEEYITDHFYGIEARIKKLESKFHETLESVNRRETQVSDVFQQVKQLIDIQFNETKKGIGRDNEMRALAEQFEHLRQEVLVKQTMTINGLKHDIDAFHNELQAYGTKLMEDVEEKLRKRDDATYRFEADLMAIKKSFSSLRLEFQKTKKAQDFKNTSTSVFLLKAVDMKPEERKRVLRALTEQEEKSRGAVEKAETDLRDYDKELRSNAGTAIS